jgi:hypothetical protein
MSVNKKKEAFTLFDDDVEHYEEPKASNKKSSITTSEETKYDLRVLILDDIEKLKINDKDTKGKLMEIMFNEDALKKTASMSNNQRIDFINEKYKSINSSVDKSSFANDENKSKENSKENEESSVPEKKTQTDVKADSNSAISIELIHMTADAITKLETAQTNLQAVQASIKDVQKYAAKIDKSGSKIDIASKSGFRMPSIPEPIDIEPFVIEGFENIQGFAPAF